MTDEPSDAKDKPGRLPTPSELLDAIEKGRLKEVLGMEHEKQGEEVGREQLGEMLPPYWPSRGR